MPRPVVPIAPLPDAFSRATSSSWCSGRISVTFSAMRRLSGVTDDALPLQPLDLLDQRARIEHDAVADDRELVAHHARRQQRQLVGLAVDDQRVAGVMAALEADDDVGLLGEPVDDLAFAFVAPLGADHHHVRHAKPFPRPAAPIPRSRLAPAGASFRIKDDASRGKAAKWPGRPGVRKKYGVISTGW